MDFVPCEEARKDGKRSVLNWMSLGIRFAVL